MIVCEDTAALRERASLPVLVLVDASVAVTGAFVCARNIARALKDSAQVILVIPNNSCITSDEAEPFAVVHRLPIRPLRRQIGAQLTYFPMLALASLQLRLILYRTKARGLIINDFPLMHGVFCRLLGYRGWVVTWIRINPAAFGKLLSGLWLRSGAAASNRLVVVSHHTRSCLPPDMKTDVVYDGLDPLPPPTAPNPETPRFVYIGNYIPGKGQDKAIEAFLPVANEFPTSSLHFFGGDMGLPRNRAYKARLAARVVELNLTDRVMLHDFAPNPFMAMRGARAAVNLSTSETFSMTVLEAQGAGLPVIATRSGGPQEIIVEGKTGFLVDVSDTSAMTGAMRKLARDPLLAETMGAAARQRVARHFSPPAFLESLQEILPIISGNVPAELDLQ